MNKLLVGILYGIVGQALTFLQLQGHIKYGWFQKYPIMILAGAIPISFVFIKSVENLVAAYNGELWPSRLIGFGIGAIVFTILSCLLFKEPFTLKTSICMILAATILIIQIIWK